MVGGLPLLVRTASCNSATLTWRAVHSMLGKRDQALPAVMGPGEVFFGKNSGRAAKEIEADHSESSWA
jgi:hypothetical protein